MHYKLMKAMTEPDAYHTLSDKVGCRSENKAAFVAAVSMSDDGRPMRIKLNTASGFKLKKLMQLREFLDNAYRFP